MKSKLQLLLIGALLYVTGAQAHHSAALYDVTKKIEISGTLKAVLFANPHSRLTLVTAGANGAEEVWEIESSSPLMLGRRGWVFGKIKAGDKATISGAPLRSGDKGLYMTGIRLQDGTAYGRSDPDIKGLD